MCAVYRAAASEGGDHEDAGPDTTAGAPAQHQVRATAVGRQLSCVVDLFLGRLDVYKC